MNAARRSTRLQSKQKQAASTPVSEKDSLRDNDEDTWAAGDPNDGGLCEFIPGECDGPTPGDWTVIRCVGRRDDPDQPGQVQYNLHYVNSHRFWWTSNCEKLDAVQEYLDPDYRSSESKQGTLAGSSSSTTAAVPESDRGSLYDLTRDYSENHCVLIALNVFFGYRVAESFKDLFEIAGVQPKKRTKPKMADFSRLKLADGSVVSRNNLVSFLKVKRGGSMGQEEILNILGTRPGKW